MKENTKQTLMAFLRAGIAMVIFVIAIVYYDSLKSIDVRALVEASANVAVAILMILGVYFIKSVLFVIPASLIYISVGMAFPPLEACLINFGGILIEVCATYVLGIFLGGDYVEKLLSKNKAGRKLLEKQFNNKFLILLGIRALPVFPIDFVSLFWGASHCSFLKYLGASLLGILPRVALFTVLGDGIYDYIPMTLLVKIVICAIPFVVAFSLVKFFVSKRKQK